MLKLEHNTTAIPTPYLFSYSFYAYTVCVCGHVCVRVVVGGTALLFTVNCTSPFSTHPLKAITLATCMCVCPVISPLLGLS